MQIPNTLFVFLFLLLTSCITKTSVSTRFVKIESEQTGIDFSNDLVFNKDFNIYTYRNFYNGGGVGLGDFNNDGLLDVYLTANMKPNKLFLNKGDLRFEDITENAGVAGKKAWSTGVAVADINGDGFQDIYVCNSGDLKGDNKENELFINNGNLTFTERAAEYGLNDKGFTTHAAFFDYDNDGDLDAYILNNSYQAIGSFNLRKNERPLRDSMGGDKLLRNDDGKFTDISEQAGVFGSVIGFGLGVTVGDANKDGWMDIYVSNDFFERDYLYINRKDGTFEEVLTSSMKSISGASMGADMADINNDAYPDIFVTDMLPFENDRIKTVTTFEDWNRYQYNLRNDYFHQFTRNTLQLNNGNGTFSEIGRLSGVEATDWSWGALMFDMDNDGRKDIFIANGIYKDLTNQDFLQFAGSEEFVKSVVTKQGLDYEKLVDVIPSKKVPNFAYHNTGNLSFVNEATSWGLGEESFSNGSAYGDFDNDGDMDIIVNGVNSPAVFYRNDSKQNDSISNYLKFILKGSKRNSNAVGANITIHDKDDTFYLEQMPIRGFESTVDHRLNFGLGKRKKVDRIEVRWPNKAVTVLENIDVNQTIKLTEPDYSDQLGEEKKEKERSNKILFESVTRKVDFIHQENEYSDFDRNRMLYHMMSTQGPCLCKADVNGDGLEDFFIGGSKGQKGSLFIQNSNWFDKASSFIDDLDAQSEDTRCAFFDADKDGDQDLYVASGGSEFSSRSIEYSDRLYFNNGFGKFNRSGQLLPTFKFENTSTVTAGDFDGDGDNDLFVGIFADPDKYGLPSNGYLLENDGKGSYKDVTHIIAKDLSGIGMITDATWGDIDKDMDLDLLLVGEWMGIRVFINDKGKLRDRTIEWGLSDTHGWWTRIEANDFDNDGDIDFVIGNHGLNSRFRASNEKPISMWVNDFDKNGSIEQIISSYYGDKQYPFVLKHDLISQIPSLKKKYLKYDDYKAQQIQDIFLPDQLASSIKLKATLLTSVILENSNGKFKIRQLPIEAQLSPVYGIDIEDFDQDGFKDVLLGGNFYSAKPEVGRYDASYGTFLKGDGKGDFKAVPNKDCGLMIDGEVRDIKRIKVGKDNLILVARNNDTPLFLKLNE
jgi:enediyne biosynthesis protein E4